jgi:hypothetical protein
MREKVGQSQREKDLLGPERPWKVTSTSELRFSTLKLQY